MRVFDVELAISGPVTISKAISFNTDKELQLGNVFLSSINVKKNPQGFLISSTVYTTNQDRAYKIALLFIGKMLDVMSIKTNFSLNVSSLKYKLEERNVKAQITEDEFRQCFDIARTLNLQHTKLLRAYSWYRKGLYTEDPFDKFLAFWNSISVLADGYCNDNDRTRLGVINKIWDCFITLWGECENWQYVNGDRDWINNNNEIRNKIAHGGVSVDIEYVENVISKLDVLQKIAYLLLTQWSVRLGINLNIIDQ